MPITCALALQEASTTDTDPYVTTATLTPTAGRGYIVGICTSLAVTVDSLTGAGITWTEVGNEIRGSIFRVTAFEGVADGGAFPEVLTFDYSAGGTGQLIIAAELAGSIDTSDMVVQFDGKNGTGTISDADLAAFASPNNGTLYFGATNGAGAMTPGGVGYAQLADLTILTPGRKLSAQFLASPDTDPNCSFASTQWVGFGMELRGFADTPVEPDVIGLPAIMGHQFR